MDETPPQPEAAAGKDSFLDKAKNFITMGGDKDKWTKAIIVSVIVVLFMGLGSTAVWGVALAFWVRSIGEPNGNIDAGGGFQIIKTMDVNITTYSPVIGSNTCDGPATMGGTEITADGNGKFVFENGKIQWKSKTKTLDHIFAEPVDYRIIPWNQINQQSVQIPGFMNSTPFEIHDTYAGKLKDGKVVSGEHVTHGQLGNFLDFSYTCGEGNDISKQLLAVQKSQGVKQIGTEGTTVRVNIVQPSAGGGISGASTACSAKIVSTAQGQVGYSIPGGDGHYTTNKYDGGAYAWCASFASWVYKQAGYLSRTEAGTISLQDNYSSQIKVTPVDGNPNNVKPGDIFWVGAGTNSGFHVGIITSVSGKTVSTVEGNTHIHSVNGTLMSFVWQHTRQVSELKLVARPKSCP